MKITGLLLVIVVAAVVAAEVDVQKREHATSSSNSWLKGLLSKLFGNGVKNSLNGESNSTASSTITRGSIFSTDAAGINTGPSNFSQTTSTVNSSSDATGTSSVAFSTSTIASQTSGTGTPTSTSGTTNLSPRFPASTTGTPLSTTSYATSISGPSTTATTTTTSGPASNGKCFAPIPLDKFCILPHTFDVYLNGNKTAETVYWKLFSKDIMARLTGNCKAGDWCLSQDKLSLFAKLKNDFYNGPMCDGGFVECLTLVAENYRDCPVKKMIRYLANSIGLLCQMKKFEPSLTDQCFGETVATLHLSRAAVLHIEHDTHQTHRGMDLSAFCHTARAKLTKSFLCNTQRCPGLQIMLDTFYPWGWFLRVKPRPLDLCKFLHPCEGKGLTHHSATSGPGTSATPAAPNNGLNPEEHSFFYVVTGNDSTSLVVGVAIGTAVALIGVTILVCACHKRARRTNGVVYRSGYKKLPNDDDP